MERIETDAHYAYTRLFDAVIDKEKLRSETVGKDADGNLILHISETYNVGNAYSSADEYYILTADEYRSYVGIAHRNKLIRRWAGRKFLKEVEGSAPPRGKIVSFSIVKLRTSGMRFTAEHEIVMQDGQAEVSEYGIRYQDGEKTRVLQRRVVRSEADVLRLLNDCALLSWDGFHGAHPKGVLDGTMFSLEATVNGGRTIRADGSQNFPRHYRDFTDGLHAMLSESK